MKKKAIQALRFLLIAIIILSTLFFIVLIIKSRIKYQNFQVDFSTATDVWFLIFNFLFLIPIFLENLPKNNRKIFSPLLLFSSTLFLGLFTTCFYFIYIKNSFFIDPTQDGINQTTLIKYAFGFFNMYFLFYLLSTFILNFLEKSIFPLMNLIVKFHKLVYNIFLLFSGISLYSPRYEQRQQYC